MVSSLNFDTKNKDWDGELTMVSIVNPALFNRLPRSCTEVNGEMWGAKPCSNDKLLKY